MRCILLIFSLVLLIISCENENGPSRQSDNKKNNELYTEEKKVQKNYKELAINNNMEILNPCYQEEVKNWYYLITKTHEKTTSNNVNCETIFTTSDSLFNSVEVKNNEYVSVPEKLRFIPQTIISLYYKSKASAKWFDSFIMNSINSRFDSIHRSQQTIKKVKVNIIECYRSILEEYNEHSRYYMICNSDEIIYMNYTFNYYDEDFTFNDSTINTVIDSFIVVQE